jgi:hypothetical protein
MHSKGSGMFRIYGKGIRGNAPGNGGGVRSLFPGLNADPSRNSLYSKELPPPPPTHTFLCHSNAKHIPSENRFPGVFFQIGLPSLKRLRVQAQNCEFVGHYSATSLNRRRFFLWNKRPEFKPRLPGLSNVIRSGLNQGINALSDRQGGNAR